VALNASVPWQIEVRGSLFRTTVDLTGLDVSALTVEGGANRVAMRLPRPSGTVPIRIRGGSSIITIQRPDGTAVRAMMPDGANRVELDGRQVEWIDQTHIESADYDGAADRYELEFTGGSDQITILATAHGPRSGADRTAPAAP
jgi:hypothetical protein